MEESNRVYDHFRDGKCNPTIRQGLRDVKDIFDIFNMSLVDSGDISDYVGSSHSMAE
jgi:hypothetical protein